MNLVKSTSRFYMLLIKRVYNNQYLYIINRIIKLHKKYYLREISNKKLVLIIRLKKYFYNNVITYICFEYIREALLV